SGTNTRGTLTTAPEGIVQPASRTQPPAVRGRHAFAGASARAPQQVRILAARMAALRALSSPTQPTGTPGGICTIERIASSPPAALRRPDSGTPITGRSVWAATAPGSAAEMPAPALPTRSPRVSGAGAGISAALPGAVAAHTDL